MPRIRVNTDVLRLKAGEFLECMEDQRQVIAEAVAIINDLAAVWEGEAQKRFIAAFENARPTYEKFAFECVAFATYMQHYADVWEYIDIGGREDLMHMVDNRTSPQPNPAQRTPRGAWRMDNR